MQVNHHTLAEFRSLIGEFLDALLRANLLASLMRRVQLVPAWFEIETGTSANPKWRVEGG